MSVGLDPAHNGRLALAQDRQDGHTGVTTDNRDAVLGRLSRLADNTSDKGRGADNVEVGDTEQPVLVSWRSKHNLKEGVHFLGSNTPAFLRTSAKTGTVELTGLEMTRMNALGQALAMDWARVAQIPALILESDTCET